MKGSGQRAHSEKSGGRRIDDHSFWAGKARSGDVLPEGSKKYHIKDSPGAGSLMRYEDTEQEIHEVQSKQDGQIKKHQGRLPDYRH